MYTLHVVASERRLAQITLPGSSMSVERTEQEIENSESFSDDSDGELLGLDLDNDSQAIEFTAGNPRVEHITGVVHLYRPTPGRLPQNVEAPLPLAAPTGPRSTTETGKSGAGGSLFAPGASPEPTKGAASWASLFAQSATGTTGAAQHPPPNRPVAQPPAGERCDELCCLALPSDMTIADFFTFLGAHLLRMRLMRVLRRQVGPSSHHTAAALLAPTHAGPSAAGPGPACGGSAAASASPVAADASSIAQSAQSAGGAGCRNSRPGSNGGSAASTSDGNGGATQGSATAHSSLDLGGPADSSGPGPDAAPTATDRRNLPGSDGQDAVRPPGSSNCLGARSSAAAMVQGHPHPPHPHPHPHPRPQSPPSRQQQQQQPAADKAGRKADAVPVPPALSPQPSNGQAAAAGAGHRAARPPSQRVVCMVVMRMESPEAADELYADLNGKPFSSLEPDIVCRLVYVRHVEVTSGSGRPLGGSGAADASAPQLPGPGTAAEPASGLPQQSQPPAQQQQQQSQQQPPPGQTELPTCPVCLERLDEHISGIVTTVCNHMFHSECLQKWADTTCPVCRYCVQGAANTSRCGVCATAVDLWICLICGHVGCGRYRAGHAADHWRTSGHCYALELETQRVWDYVGDNYVHRLIQSKTDGKLVELAAPASAVASPHAGGRGGGHTRHHYHHQHHHSDGASCGAAGGLGGSGRGSAGPGSGVLQGRGGDGCGDGGEWGPAGGGDGVRGTHGGAGGSELHGGYDGSGWSTADDELKEALMASKLDAIAAEYNHLLASQLDSQRQYFEGLVAQSTLDADHRCAQAGAAADKARQEAEEAQAAAREEARRRTAAERKASETAEALRTIRQEAEFLRSLNETLLANQKDFKQQLAAERARAEVAEASVKELQEQVRDLAFFIEAQRTINDAGGGELQNGTILPLPQQGSAATRSGRGGGSGTGSRARTPGGGGSRPSAR